MGDILHGLPAIAALRQHQPDNSIGWAVEPHWKPLLADKDAALRGPAMPLIDQVHTIPTRRWKERSLSFTGVRETLREIAGIRREMVAERYDVCIDLQGSIRSAMIARFSGATRVLGPRHPREFPAAVFYRERVHCIALHVIQQACELMDAALKLPVGTLRPAVSSLPVDPAAEKWADCILRALQPGLRERFVLLTPKAGWGAKEWPPEKYQAVAAELHQAGFSVLVNAMTTDDPTAAFIASCGDAMAVPCDLPQLIALTRRAALVIGGDTGPVHLAAALGRPVLALFGPTDPMRNGPAFPGSRTHILRHASSQLDHRRHAQIEVGLARITIEEVVAAAGALLQSDGKSTDG